MGDAIGLPYEGLSARRGRKLLGPPTRHRFLPGRGMFSDDTEHACMVAQCLLRSDGTVESFQRHFARSLRGWILCLPAGVGRATLRSCIKLLCGFSPASSGVASAGNGPAMRTALFGVLFADDSQRLQEFVRASTRITHTDPIAEEGALLVARAARAFHLGLDPLEGTTSPAFTSAMDQLRESLKKGESPMDFARIIGGSKGVSGYIVHTVAVAFHAAISASDFRSAVIQSVDCGGDTDTVAAIAGALAGVRFGPEAVPSEWCEGVLDFPLSISRIEEIARRLDEWDHASGISAGPVPIPRLLVPLRNLFFLLIVFLHVLRRALPPY
jgi:ADP-ribosylglycohydrolase